MASCDFSEIVLEQSFALGEEMQQEVKTELCLWAHQGCCRVPEELAAPAGAASLGIPAP